ncbi:E3 ubiquitin-protein ligase TRIM45-like [Saccostrea echinata]|uniref:E3 ubiquitin-protein ligase TRIM45-like n=1 Tax=Saccostrea echinata TaxID=191078 RepID=UPI002A820E8D|nr:E3 ubiquitin-protein ligase TRIM45-like [Saccostrea echinata]
MYPRTTAQDLMRCDLCETAIVQMHCDRCLANLCKACVGEHISKDDSKDHKVVNFQYRNTTPLYPDCASHEEEQCAMYCRHCDIPVCHSCLATNHHLSHTLSKILQVLSEKQDMIKKEQTELHKRIYPTYKSIASDVQIRISQLEEEYGDLSATITQHGNNLHQQIDQLVSKFKAQANETKVSQLESLKKHLDDINKKIDNMKIEIDSLDTAANSNDISTTINVRSIVDQYKKLPQKLVSFVPKFIPGPIQGEELHKLFGALLLVSDTSEEDGYSMKTTQESSEEESFPPVGQNTSEARSSPQAKQQSSEARFFPPVPPKPLKMNLFPSLGEQKPPEVTSPPSFEKKSPEVTSLPSFEKKSPEDGFPSPVIQKSVEDASPFLIKKLQNEPQIFSTISITLLNLSQSQPGLGTSQQT